jgi:hypothetical protein
VPTYVGMTMEADLLFVGTLVAAVSHSGGD